MPSALIKSLYMTKKNFPEMNSVAKNASPSVLKIKKIDIFLRPLKKWKSKIGLSHALGTYKESLYDEKKISGNE